MFIKKFLSIVSLMVGIVHAAAPWSTPVSLVEGTGRLAIGNRVHVVGHNGSNLVHQSSQDNGATWSSPSIISTNAFDNYPFQYGGFFAIGDTLYLLTAAGNMGGTSQHADFRKSTDNGKNWSSRVRVTGTGFELRRARIIAYKNFVHVAGGSWPSIDGNIVYFRSADGGKTWSPGVKVG